MQKAAQDGWGQRKNRKAEVASVTPGQDKDPPRVAALQDAHGEVGEMHRFFSKSIIVLAGGTYWLAVTEMKGSREA